MKKTLIALVALSSVAMAATETIDGQKLNADVQYRLNEDPYTGGSFVLTFGIKAAADFGNQRGFITLGTDDKALQVWSQQGTYVGLTTNGNPNSWSTSTNASGVNTFTFDGAPNSWISKNASGANWNPGVANSAWTISYNGENKTTIEVVFHYGQSDVATEYITINNYAMDLRQFSVLDAAADSSAPRLSQITGAKVYYNGAFHDLMTPEPATATLSLLALAGLAARRRRH